MRAFCMPSFGYAQEVFRNDTSEEKIRAMDMALVIGTATAQVKCVIASLSNGHPGGHAYKSLYREPWQTASTGSFRRTIASTAASTCASSGAPRPRRVWPTPLSPGALCRGGLGGVVVVVVAATQPMALKTAPRGRNPQPNAASLRALPPYACRKGSSKPPASMAARHPPGDPNRLQGLPVVGFSTRASPSITRALWSHAPCSRRAKHRAATPPKAATPTWTA